MSSKPSILTRGQKRLLCVLMVASTYLVANAAYLHLCPPQKSVPRRLLPVDARHPRGGRRAAPPPDDRVRALAPSRARSGCTTSGPSRPGVVVTVAALALFVTGLFIFSKANSIENRWAFISHQVARDPRAGRATRRTGSSRTSSPSWKADRPGGARPGRAASPCMVGVHFATLPAAPPRRRRRWSRKPAEGVDPFKDAFPDYGTSAAPTPTSVFLPASTRTITGALLPQRLLTNADLPAQAALEADVAKYGFAVNARIGSETCARCHQDIVEQWARSAHRFASFNNPFYRVSVEALRKEDDGRQRSQWCAGCHDPAIMMAGNMTKDIQPLIPESQAGLTCLACHAMDEVHGVGGNGGYRIADARARAVPVRAGEVGPARRDPRPAHPLEARRAQAGHAEARLPHVGVLRHLPQGLARRARQPLPLAARPERVRRPPRLRHHAQQRADLLPAARGASRCQDCHMPLVDAPLGDLAAKAGKVRSHQFFGPNTALPADPRRPGDREGARAVPAEGTERQGAAPGRRLRGQARRTGRSSPAPDLREIALEAGETVEIQVVVRNQDVGHTFPGGTLDSNEAWIHFRAADAQSGERPLRERRRRPEDARTSTRTRTSTARCSSTRRAKRPTGATRTTSARSST